MDGIALDLAKSFAALMGEPPLGSGQPLPTGAWTSARGLKRPDQQDRLAIARLRSDLLVAVVCDGMGGMRDGGLAASVATASAVAYITLEVAHRRTQAASEQLLSRAIHFANEQVFRALKGGGGAVMVVAAISAREACIAHVGDARAYRVTKNQELQRLTTDDTLLDLLKKGPADSALHTQLLQFVGMGASLEAHTNTLPLDDQWLLLTTDGVHSLPVAVMEWLVLSTAQATELARKLVIASEWNGGKDNATAVIIGRPNDTSSQAVEIAFGHQRVALPVELMHYLSERPNATRETSDPNVNRELRHDAPRQDPSPLHGHKTRAVFSREEPVITMMSVGPSVAAVLASPALPMMPNAAEAARQGGVALEAGHLERAHEHYSRALKLDPGNPEYLAALPWIEFLGSEDKMQAAIPAKRALKEIIARSRWAQTPHLYIGKIESEVIRVQNDQRQHQHSENSDLSHGPLKRDISGRKKKKIKRKGKP